MGLGHQGELKFGPCGCIEYHWGVRKLLLKLSLNLIAILPLAVVQVIGAVLGFLAYICSKHYRSLFRPQYESVVNSHHLPFKLWHAVRASGMLLSLIHI